MSNEVDRQQYVCECGGRYFAPGEKNHLQTLRHQHHLLDIGICQEEIAPPQLVPAKPKGEGRGLFFECSWRSPLEKLTVARKLQSMKEVVEAFAIGVEPEGYPLRTIAIVKTFKRTSILKFRELIQSNGGEIKRCEKWKALVKKITRNETEAVVHGFPTTYLNIRYRAYKYAQGHEKVIWDKTVPCSLGENKRFENLVCSFRRRRTDPVMRNAKLNTWQNDLSNYLSTRNQTRWWVYDESGGTGKTFFANYLRITKGALTFENFRPKYIIDQYRCQSLIVFDFLNSSRGKISYNHLYRLADGQVGSLEKTVPLPYGIKPTVICFSTFRPNLKVLREAGWTIFNIDKTDNLTFLSFDE